MFWTILVLSLSLIHPQEARAEFNPKVKVVATLGLYGTVSGTLLGAASMAFGTGSRAIFQGASLGLYAGLIFGTYIVMTHKEQREVPADGYYPNAPDAGGYRPEGEGKSEENGNENVEYRYDPYLMQQEALERGALKRSGFGTSREKGVATPLYMNLLMLQF